MMRALYSGVSGLKTHQTKMDVIGNNISNVNTVGFKASSTTFADIMYQTTSGATAATATTGGKNAMQIGLGVSTADTKVSITSPGAAQSTGDALDIRLTNGSSTNFFIVNNGTENLFTRAGSCGKPCHDINRLYRYGLAGRSSDRGYPQGYRICPSYHAGR